MSALPSALVDLFGSGQNTTLAGSGLSAGGSILGGVGGFMRGESMGDAQRAAARLEAERFRQRSESQLGQTRAAFAASGATMEGTPLEVLTDAAAEAEMNAQLIEFGGEQRARRAEREGQAALAEGFMGAFADLFEGLESSGSLQDDDALDQTATILGGDPDGPGPLAPPLISRRRSNTGGMFVP